jgi:alpha-maltose-1-phosphate synthase
MKVLLFSAQWPEYMIELANAMAELEQVYLMLPINHRFTPRHRELISDKVNFIPFLGISHQSRRQGLPHALKILFHVWRIRPDVMHIQANGGYPFLWVFRYLPKKTKVVNTIHDPVLHLGDEPSIKAHNQQVIDTARKYTSHYIVHGEFLRQQLAKSYNVSLDRISVIPHGHFEIYKKFASKESKIEHQNYILFFGRIWKYKGLQHFIDAAEMIIGEHPNTMFYIVGVGEPISNYSFNPDHRDNFVLINRYVALEEISHIFEKCAFVVMPYIEATQSGVIPIAFAFEKPVIATSVGSIPEVLSDGHTGFLVPANDTSALRTKIIELLDNKSLLETMSRNALHTTTKELGWTSIAKKTLLLYTNLIK